MSEETCVQVALRIRPLVSSEISRGCQQCIQKVNGEPQVNVRGDRLFTYNYVFDEMQSQDDVYESAVKGLVTRLFKGYNVTIVAYGQTGSGKTYSMGTCYSEDKDNLGIIPRAIADIFKTIAKTKDWEYKVKVSFMELYQEQLFDLLAEQRCSVDLREENKEIRVPNLTEKPVSNTEETVKCLTQGSIGRATGATAMNSQSSRSHAIFTITISQQNLLDENEAMHAKFHLVDLAGSERSKKTLATGERFKEGVNINRGLLALGNVISALGEEGQKSYISYRDSKLTRLLQDSLGGNSLTLMIACVSPADYNLEETISTLRYADRAKRIKNKPIVNQDQRVAELLRYKQQVKQLQLQLLGIKGSGDTCPVEHQNLIEENNFLVSKIRRLTEALTNALVESASLSELALTAERSRDLMQAKLSDLRAKFGHTVDGLNLANKEEKFSPLLQAALDELNKHGETILDLEADQKRSCEEILKKELSHTSFNIKMETNSNENDSMSSTADIDLRHEEHTTQQQELNKELQDLNRALALKEELASEMAKTSNHLRNIQPASEFTMKEFQEQIDSLQKEKEKLIADLKNMHQHNNSSKLAEQRRKRLQELEHKISDLTKKVCEQAKIIKMNEQNDKKIIKLNEDIQSMKQAKVRLVRQMRSENERFREWQLERKREICKLKDQDRRRQNQIVRMERLHTKQQNVLKRKWEHASAANKRLMDALAVQKSAQERRLNQGHGSSISRLQTFLGQEMEVVLSRFEATRTLDHLLEDRALLHDQRNTLQNNLKENDLTDRERNDLTKEIKQLTEDLDIRNIQIEDLQQKLINTDQDNKYKVKWDCLQSMAEAKFAVKYLFDLTIEAKREVSMKDYKLEELQDAHRQAVGRLEQHEQKLREMSLKHQKELVSIEKEHQDKVLVLLRQLRGIKVAEEGSHLAESLHVLIQGLEKNDSLKEEIEKRDAEILALKNQLLAPIIKSGRSSLFPVAVPLLPVKVKKPTKIPTSQLVLDLSEIEDSEDDTDKDPDWQKTPIFKRIQKMKSRSDDKDESRQAVKRSSDGQAKCTCKGMCRNKLCGCRKVGTACGSDCKCDRTVCKNQQDSSVSMNKKLDLENETTCSEENHSGEESFKKPRFLPFQESNRLT